MKNILREKIQNNEEPLLVVDERSGFYIFGGLFGVVVFFLFFLMLINTEIIILKIFGLLFLWLGFDILTNLLSFEKIIVYGDKIVIERNFLKDINIKTEDIEAINSYGGSLILSTIGFYTKNRNFLGFKKYFSIYALKDDDKYCLRDLMNKIKQGV